VSAYSAEELDALALELIRLVSRRTLPLADRNRLLHLVEIFRREREEHEETCFDCLPEATRERFERQAAEVE
jgi:hypothetical protein